MAGIDDTERKRSYYQKVGSSRLYESIKLDKGKSALELLSERFKDHTELRVIRNRIIEYFKGVKLNGLTLSESTRLLREIHTVIHRTIHHAISSLMDKGEWKIVRIQFSIWGESAYT